MEKRSGDGITVCLYGVYNTGRSEVIQNTQPKILNAHA